MKSHLRRHECSSDQASILALGGRMMSARDFMNGCRGTDQMDSGFASSGGKIKIKRMAQKCCLYGRQVHASYLPRSGLTQSPPAPGLGLRPVGRARNPEAWAPLGAANPHPRPAGGAPAPRGRGVPGRPALRPSPLASPACASEAPPGTASL